MKLTRMVLGLGMGLAQGLSATAGTLSNETLAGLSLDQLLDVPVSVATLTHSTTRESPGVVSVITRAQIEQLGARDLRDVLRVLPGLGIGQDAAYGLGMSMRGNWGMEGKILVLVDDQVWNEASFGSAIVNGTIPLQLVEKIEVIRGPGSVIYANYAELGVIKITTRANAKTGGNLFAGSSTSLRDSHRSLAGFNYRSQGAIEFSVQAAADRLQLSDQHHEDLSGVWQDNLNHTPIEQEFGSFGVRHGDLSFNAIHQLHHFSGYGDYESATPYLQSEFNMSLYELKYVQNASDSFSIDYRANYREVAPWISDETRSLEGDFHPRQSFDQNVTSRRAAITAYGTASQTLSWVGGIEYSHDVNQYTTYAPYNQWNTGGDELAFFNSTGFSQLEYRFPFGTLTAGGRLEKHSRFGSFWVPRLGWQNVYRKFHYKLLASRAFRNPSFQNYDANISIRRERTRVYELEAGYQLATHSYLTLNLFDTRILNPIIYYLDDDMAEYMNYPSSGSRGLEVEYQFRHEAISLNLNYSFYRAAYLNADLYEITNQSTLMLGSPANKIALYGGWTFLPNWELGGSLIYESRKYGQRYLDDQSGHGVGVLPSTVLANLTLGWPTPDFEDLKLQLGLYNITNEKYFYVQPYLNSSSAPIADVSREVLFSANYGW